MPVEDHRCKDCKFFYAWEVSSFNGRNADGVCVAVRPALGTTPNREVHRYYGSGCHAFQGKKGGDA